MNLVLHPSSGGHATSSYPSRRMKKPPTAAYSVPPPSATYDSQPSTSTSAPVTYPPRQEGQYPSRAPEDGAGYPQRPDGAYGPPRPEGAGYAGRPEVCNSVGSRHARVELKYVFPRVGLAYTDPVRGGVRRSRRLATPLPPCRGRERRCAPRTHRRSLTIPNAAANWFYNGVS